MADFRVRRQKIHETIRERILSGEYTPDTHLTELRLAEEFKVSRTPVREALRLLEREGLVHCEPQWGAFVRRYDADEVRETYEVREALEGLAARKACENMTPERAAKLHALCDEFERTVAVTNLEPMLAVEIRFHTAVAEMAGNRKLQDILDTFRPIVRSLRISLGGPDETRSREMREENVQRHRGIVEALLSGDPARAEQAMRAHIRIGLANSLGQARGGDRGA